MTGASPGLVMVAGVKGLLTIGLAALAACNPAAAETDRSRGTEAPAVRPAPAPDPAATRRPTGLVINEVAAAGEPDDWFELINVGDRAIDLTDYVYVDARGDLDRARAFPGFELEPGERHVQYVRRAVGGFQLGADESLWIYRASDGALADGVDWARGAAPRHGSYARIPDGTGAFRTLTRDTQDAPNR